MTDRQFPVGKLMCDPRMSGKVVMASGTVTVETPCAAATHNLFAMSNSSGVKGILRVENIVEGVSFDIISSNAGDAGDVAWLVICNV